MGYLQIMVIIFIHPCGVQGAQLPAGCGQSPRRPLFVVPCASYSSRTLIIAKAGAKENPVPKYIDFT